MRYLIILNIIMLCSLFTVLDAQENERIVSQVLSVDLIEVEKIDENEHENGADYYAYNGNEFPVKVKIKIRSKVNVDDGLITGELVISPNEAGYLGWVLQKDIRQGGNWSVEWEVTEY